MGSVRQERRTEWSRWVAKWERSGLSLAAFARREKLSAARLGWWSRRLRTPGDEKRLDREDAIKFVELVAETRGVGVEVVLRDGMVMRVPVGFDEATVCRLVRTLHGGVA